MTAAPRPEPLNIATPRVTRAERSREMAQTFDERRVELAKRISRVEGVPLSQAMRMVPTTKKEVDELVARLNSNHGADRSPNGQKIARANARSRETGESFGTAARKTK